MAIFFSKTALKILKFIKLLEVSLDRTSNLLLLPTNYQAAVNLQLVRWIFLQYSTCSRPQKIVASSSQRLFCNLEQFQERLGYRNFFLEHSASWKDSPLELRGNETLTLLSVSMSRGPCPRQSVISTSDGSTSINLSSKQSIERPINQSINHQINRSSDRSINQSLGAMDSDSALCKYEQKSLPPPD
jgi:hypothetical protein